MRRVLKVVVVVLLVLFVAIQFIRPERTNPPISAANVLVAPRNIQPILKRSCYDCHSSETHWPWYSNIAPMSWLLVKDVREGREEMSFSDWNTYTPRKRAHKLEEICEQVEHGEMPLTAYTLIHPGAKLTIEDKRALCVWANEARGGRGRH